jgi:hypothetical protein
MEKSMTSRNTAQSAVGRGMQTARPPVRRKARQSFDLVLAFSTLGVALISAVALVGDLVYALPSVLSLLLWVVPLVALLLVGFAVLVRKSD